MISKVLTRETHSDYYEENSEYLCVWDAVKVFGLRRATHKVLLKVSNVSFKDSKTFEITNEQVRKLNATKYGDWNDVYSDLVHWVKEHYDIEDVSDSPYEDEDENFTSNIFHASLTPTK